MSKSIAEANLYRATQARDLNTVQKIIRENPIVNLNFVPSDSENYVDGSGTGLHGEGNTPLLYALSQEDLDTASFLLEAGADPWLTNQYGINALHMLMMVFKDIDKPKTDKVLAFFDRLANNKQFNENVAKPANDGRTPLMLAASFMPFQLMFPIMEKLRTYKGVLEYSAERSNTPLWPAILNGELSSRNRSEQATQEKLDYFRKILPDAFAAVELIKAPNNQNALECAVDVNNIAWVKYCLEQDPKAWQEAMNRKPGILNKLLDTHINSDDLKDQMDMIMLLIKNGADIEVQNNLKKTFIDRLRELPTKSWVTPTNRAAASQILKGLEDWKAEQRRTAGPSM